MRGSFVSLVWEFSTISVGSALLATYRPASMEEKAALTYRAISKSDDIVCVAGA